AARHVANTEEPSLNKIYRKVWSRSLSRIVVASELASSPRDGAGCAATGATAIAPQRRVPLALRCVALLWALAPVPSAADGVCIDPATQAPLGTTSGSGTEGPCGEGAASPAPHAVAIGANASAGGEQSLAVGYQATAAAAADTATGAFAQASGGLSSAYGYMSQANGAMAV